MIRGIEAFAIFYGIIAVIAICINLFLHTPAGRHWLKKL